MVEIAQCIETIARHLLGEPNRVLSKPGRELRFGRAGQWRWTSRKESGTTTSAVRAAGSSTSLFTRARRKTAPMLQPG